MGWRHGLMEDAVHKSYTCVNMYIGKNNQKKSRLLTWKARRTGPRRRGDDAWWRGCGTLKQLDDACRVYIPSRVLTRGIWCHNIWRTMAAAARGSRPKWPQTTAKMGKIFGVDLEDFRKYTSKENKHTRASPMSPGTGSRLPSSQTIKRQRQR